MNLIQKLNRYGQSRTPILFIIDFKVQNYYIFKLNQLNQDTLFYIDGVKNFKSRFVDLNNLELKKYPIELREYRDKFQTIQEEIASGNSYLLNLTSKSKIELNRDLLDIFYMARAKFKLYFRGEFICFSPERFVEIEQDKIYTYPMKGTINADIEDAKSKILENPKELAEHTMVVDLLRNDLGIISKRVSVERFRYIERVIAKERELYQVSSKISAQLERGWQNRLGEILVNMLPAGSISGTPKRESLKIIERVEGYSRDFFTGIFGYFDGERVDSSVMIRFIERDRDNLFYKSGGGITSDSDLNLEYQEMIDKIYIPI